jgi:hypothetical protein
MNPLKLISIPCRDLECVEIQLHVPYILPLRNAILGDIEATSIFTDCILNAMGPFFLKHLSLNPF